MSGSSVDAAVNDSELSGPEHLVREDLVSLRDVLLLLRGVIGLGRRLAENESGFEVERGSNPTMSQNLPQPFCSHG